MTTRRNLPEVWRGGVVGSPRDLVRLQRNIDRIFDDFISPFSDLWAGVEESTGFFPPLDVEDTDTHYLVSLDLPGVNKEDVRLQFRNHQLIISGERRQETRREDGRRLGAERVIGAFQRMVTLPGEVEAEKAEANFENGVLQIAIPKAAEARARTIQISESKGGIFKKLLGRTRETREEEKEEKPEKEQKGGKAA